MSNFKPLHSYLGAMKDSLSPSEVLKRTYALLQTQS